MQLFLQSTPKRLRFIVSGFPKMADPFEVRLRFTNLLSHLSASATASIKTAHYALKHRDMDEDLHSCILENLERNNMNNRANIMYFLEHFCDMAIKEHHEAYVDMVRRDMARIVEAVAPATGPGGGANVKVVRRVVGILGERGVLDEEVVRGIEETLKGREGGTGRLLGDGQEDGAPREENDEMIDAPAVETDVEAPQQKKTEADSQRATPRTGATATGTGGKPNGILKVDKRVIEQRIEEDRERNKRLRESVWAVGGDDGEELGKMWEEGSEVGEDDHVLADEEADERRQAVRYSHADHST